MPFNFRLNLQSVFRRLGIQSGARLPQLDDNVQMTMQVTDLSRLIPAPIEPRGLAGVNFLGAAGRFATCQLRALAAGGVFIESILLRGSSPLTTHNYFVDVSLVDLALPAAPNINIGGTQILSRFTAGNQVVLAGVVTLPSPAGFESINLEFGIFVPNQSFFTLAMEPTNARLDITLVYRELPSIEEVG